MKNLLFINGHLNPGGCERSLTDILRHIDYTKYHVDLLLFEGMGEYAGELPGEVNVIFYDITKTFGSCGACVRRALRERDGFTLALRSVMLFCKLFGMGSLRFARGLFRRLKKNYDCAVAYRPGFCTDFAAYAVRADKKISWWHHGAIELRDNERRSLRLAYDRMDFVAAVSEGCRQLLLHEFPGMDGKLVTVPNMIDADEIKKKAEEYQADMRGGGTIKIVSIGRLSPEKNMVICPDICKMLIQRGFQVKWYLIGSGAQEKEISDKIEGDGLSGSMFLLGSLSNPYPYIKAADIYVHPSLVESQGISVLEAMALARPVVAAASLGPAEFIKNGENGILTRPAAGDICGGIIPLLQQPPLCNRVAENAEKTAGLYRPEKVMALFYNLIGNAAKE